VDWLEFLCSKLDSDDNLTTANMAVPLVGGVGTVGGPPAAGTGWHPAAVRRLAMGQCVLGVHGLSYLSIDGMIEFITVLSDEESHGLA
jgi:hypothetical protein